MNKYELVLIVNGMLPQDEKEAVLKEATEAVARNEGKIINSQLWLDKQKFTFMMRKCTHGTYYLINFEVKASGVEKIKQAIKLNEKVLRFLIIKLE